MKFSYVTLPDYPLTRIDRDDQDGRRARLLRLLRGRRDLAQGSVSPLRGGRRQDEAASASGRAWPRSPCASPPSSARRSRRSTSSRAAAPNASSRSATSASSRQYGMDWAGMKPLSRTKEAHTVMRTFLDEGAITFEGDFYTLHRAVHIRATGAEARAAPDRRHAGPEVLRGRRRDIRRDPHALTQYSRESCEYMVEHVKIGAERAGRDWRALDIGAWCVFAVAPDSAKRQGRPPGRSSPSTSPRCPPSSSSATASRSRTSKPIVEALGRGRRRRPRSTRTTPELAEKLSIAGTPEEVVEKIRTDIEPTGVNHMVLLHHRSGDLVKAFTGRDVDVPDVHAQLRLVHDEVMPAFA